MPVGGPEHFHRKKCKKKGESAPALSGNREARSMHTEKTSVSDTVITHINDLLPGLESFYTDVHAHPELSMQETRTAGLAADRLRANGFDVTTGVGKTGVVGLLHNGDGPVVMLRADRSEERRVGKGCRWR